MSVNILRNLSRLSLLRCTALLPTAIHLNKSVAFTKYPVAALNFKLQNRGNSTSADSPLDPSKFASYEEIKDLPNNPAKLLIDVREPKELEETGIIPTAINIPLKQVPEILSHDFPSDKFKALFNRQKPTVDTEIIFHCKIGMRSQNATDLCYQLGYKKRLKPEVHTEIIFSCRSGKRAEEACHEARNLGFKNVKNYKGSWIEWAEKEGLNK